MRIEVEPGIRLFVDTAGSSLRPTDEEMLQQPTLLLLHGGPGFDHSSFRPYFDRFADTHHVLYLDQRGHGRSDGANDPSRWNLDTWADDVVRVCDALGVTAPVVLGNSFGGFVATRYSARHPGHATKLVLMSTLARPNFEVTAARFETLGGPEVRDLYLRVFARSGASAEDWIEYGRRCMPLYNAMPSSFGPRRSRMNFEVLADFTDHFAQLDLREDLAAIRCPVLVIAGEDDPMTPVEAAEEMYRLLPADHRRLERITACGHGTFRDQPERTEMLLRDFLAG